jgi:hypothetical protein
MEVRLTCRLHHARSRCAATAQGQTIGPRHGRACSSTGLPLALRAELRRLDFPSDLIASAPMALALAGPDAGTTFIDVMVAPTTLTATRQLATRLRGLANFIETIRSGRVSRQLRKVRT